MANHEQLKPHQFKKGQSGNPSGRPKAVVKLQDLARENTKEALDTLIEIMKDPKQPAAARVTAADKVLDRGYGKATQFVDTTHREVSDEERHARIIEILTEAETARASNPSGAGTGNKGTGQPSKVH